MGFLADRNNLSYIAKLCTWRLLMPVSRFDRDLVLISGAGSYGFGTLQSARHATSFDFERIVPTL